MLYGTLETSLFGNILAGRGIVRVGYGNKEGKGMLRAGSGSNKKFMIPPRPLANLNLKMLSKWT